jgi:acylphosphatase
MAERIFHVQGMVQGVGFRWWTRSQAQRLGITGSVRNAPDGSVVVQARGEDAALKRFRSALQRGPELARVERILEEPGTVPENGAFVIEH